MSATKQFVICIENGDYTGTLELRKVYKSLDDTMASKKDCLRIIDESGENYLYPARWFIPVAMPETSNNCRTTSQ